jgi:alanyl-tRNA synthetase
MSKINLKIEDEIDIFNKIIEKSTKIIEKTYKNIEKKYPEISNPDIILDDNQIQYIGQLLFKCQSTYGVPSELCHEILTYKFIPQLLLYNSQIDECIDKEFINHQEISRKKPIKLQSQSV